MSDLVAMAVESGSSFADQITAGLLVIIAAVGGAAKILLDIFKPGMPKPSHLVVEQASIADVQPMRDLASELKRVYALKEQQIEISSEIRDRLARVVDLMEQREKQALVDRARQEGREEALRTESVRQKNIR